MMPPAMARIEKDSLGEVGVPDEALYGAQTQRAVENFPVSGATLPPAFTRALALLKQAAAETNVELGLLDPKLGAAIVEAAQEVADGTWNAHLVVDVFQTGSGTSTNMNMNEVLSNLAIRKLGGKIGSKTPVHPNDHVNLGQSSNDMIPSAAHLAVLLEIHAKLLPALDVLAKALEAKARDFDDVVKLGRTHLQDATPVRLGQVFGGYASQVRHGIARIRRASEDLHELALGGTAVGTGINTHPQFASKAAARLARKLSLPVREADNHFEAQGGRDAMVSVSGSLKTLACSLMKIANDIRWMASGPRAGLGEIVLKDLQPGSSIMPGKVNPVMCEVLTQVAAQVIGNDTAVTVGGQGGNFELNVMIPMMTRNLLESVALTASSCRLFAERAVAPLEANREHCLALALKSDAMVTALAPHVGYDKAAALVKTAAKEGKTVLEVARAQRILPEAQLEKVLDPRRMTEPSATGSSKA